MIILRERKNPFPYGRTGLRESGNPEDWLNFRNNEYIPNIQRINGLAATPKEL
ncbi:MAG: hypothetical protein LBK61_05265 [Spirochaetaceae bacterium]|jgi:hypothetical protein|nr:hypothetical protein [Spirochaetaceae bacterium]